MKAYRVGESYYSVDGDWVERVGEDSIHIKDITEVMVKELKKFDPISEELYNERKKELVEKFLPKSSSQYLKKVHEKGIAYLNLSDEGNTLISHESGWITMMLLDVKDYMIEQCVPISKNEYIDALIDAMV